MINELKQKIELSDVKHVAMTLSVSESYCRQILNGTRRAASPKAKRIVKAFKMLIEDREKSLQKIQANV